VVPDQIDRDITIDAPVERVWELITQAEHIGRWAPFKEPAGGEQGEGNSTLVEFTLTPEGDGTRLHLVETGFASLYAPDEQRAKNHAGNTRGWQVELDELARYATTVAA
jgi:uncharacterized protein YndB with AHSA1/START domain